MAGNLKTTKLLDCALIGVCAVIGSNMVLRVYTAVSENTVFALITTHAPISAQLSTLVVFTLQSMYFYLLFLQKYVVGTHLNCIDKLRQFKRVPTTYAFVKKIRKRYHISIIKYTLHEVLCWSFFKVCPYLVDILLRVFAVILKIWSAQCSN